MFSKEKDNNHAEWVHVIYHIPNGENSYIAVDGGYKCTKCKAKGCNRTSNYCPDCGRKMVWKGKKVIKERNRGV